MCFNTIKFESFSALINPPLLCKNCQKKMVPIFYKFKVDDVRALSIYKYDEVIKSLIFQYKEARDYELKDIFLWNIKEILKNKYRSYLLIPIPSHEESIKRRGFMHVNEMFSELKLPIENALVKRSSEEQKAKNLIERHNQKDLFSLIDSVSLKGKKILLIDDVCTSGSSLKSAIKLIKPLNPKKIEILVISKRFLTDEEKSHIKDKSLIID